MQERVEPLLSCSCRPVLQARCFVKRSSKLHGEPLSGTSDPSVEEHGRTVDRSEDVGQLPQDARLADATLADEQRTLTARKHPVQEAGNEGGATRTEEHTSELHATCH